MADGTCIKSTIRSITWSSPGTNAGRRPSEPNPSAAAAASAAADTRAHDIFQNWDGPCAFYSWTLHVQAWE
eukprot:SAG11_NODE_313_length_10878_cov_43.354578_10_plen_71_part_00